MDEQLRELLKIPYTRLDDINAVLLDPDSRVINDVLKVISQYGSPAEINRRAEAARQLPNLIAQVEATKPEYLKDLRWLEQERVRGAFITIQASARTASGTPRGP